MKKLIAIILFTITAFNISLAQSSTIKGQILDNNSNPLLGVNIIVSDIKFSTTTDNEGNFEIKNIPGGKYVLSISHIGFTAKAIEVSVPHNDKLIISLTDTPINLGEVTVTSTKYRSNVRNVPMPLEVITDDNFSSNSSSTLSDVVANEAGISIARDGIWATSVNIRGLSKQSIVTLVDGNRIETATNIAAGLSMIDVSDIERVEVIKGASSSLYGSGAMGGVVNIITKTGSYSNNLRIKGSLLTGYNSINNGAMGNVNLFASTEDFYARLSGTLRSAENTETPEGTLENSQFHDNNISAALGFKPFANHEIEFNYQRFEATDVGIPGGAPFPAAAIAKYTTEGRQMYSLQYSIKNISPAFVNLSAKYFYQELNRDVELHPNAAVTVKPGADHKINGAQIQSDLSFGNHYLVAGVDYWNRRYEGWRETFIAPSNTIKGDFPNPKSDYRSIGIFAQDDIDLIPNKLNLTIGGRFDQINVKNDEALNPSYLIVNGVRNDNPPHDPNASFAANDVDNYSWSGNVGLLYALYNNLDLSLNVGRSFRAPALEERFQYINLGGDIYFGNPELDPEDGLFFDVGFRLWNPDFSIRGNVFLNSFNNLIVDQEMIADSLFMKQNVGEARLYGFDLTFDYNFYGSIVLYGNAAYVRGEDTGNDQDLGEIPPFNGKLGLKFPVANYLRADLSATFASDQDKVAQGELTTTGYAYFDLYLSSIPFDFNFARMQFFAGVENITDRLYRNHLATNRGLIKSEPGRNFFVKLKLLF